MLISGRFDVFRKSDMNPSMPFFDFVARVPLLDLVPVDGTADAGGEGATSLEGMDGIVSEGSAVK